jgi:N-carbamoyl-L-amino-acid hydrolase
MGNTRNRSRVEPTDVDGDAFLRDFTELSRIGETPAGGVDRQAGTPAHRQARYWLSDWLEARGFAVSTDNIGNLFGVLEWTPGAPAILTGSHLDSQPLGGRYDGAYGVLAAAHAAHHVNQLVKQLEQPPTYNLAVVDWFNEEGARFKPSMMGSGVFTGKLDLTDALQATDRDGVTVSDILDSIRVRSPGHLPAVQAYAEIHVEQGRVLEDENIDIGLVASTWAARKYDVLVRGEQSHTGATVIEDRRDALVGAARLIVAVRELAERHTEPALLTSVGEIEVAPNSPVVVPSSVRMALDLRSPDTHLLAAADAELHELISAVESSTRVSISSQLIHAWGVQSYQEEGVAIAQSVAEDLGLSHRRMATLAGHDSTNLKDMMPTIMMFIPSVGGITHNEAELTRDDDCTNGLRLLTEVVLRLCTDGIDDDASSDAASSHVTP